MSDDTLPQADRVAITPAPTDAEPVASVIARARADFAAGRFDPREVAYLTGTSHPAPVPVPTDETAELVDRLHHKADDYSASLEKPGFRPSRDMLEDLRNECRKSADHIEALSAEVASLQAVNLHLASGLSEAQSENARLREQQAEAKRGILYRLVGRAEKAEVERNEYRKEVEHLNEMRAIDKAKFDELQAHVNRMGGAWEDAKCQIGRLTEELARVRRLNDLNVEALSEIKATVDGKSDQPVKNIIYGLLGEIAALTDPAPVADSQNKEDQA